MRPRENLESAVPYGGEEVENKRFRKTLPPSDRELSPHHLQRIQGRHIQCRLSQVSVIVPCLVIAPVYFGVRMSFDQLG